MTTIAKVAIAGAVLAVAGGFFLGRGVADPAPLPDVGRPVNVGSTAEPTPTEDPATVRPSETQRPGGDRTGRPGDDDGPATADDDDGDDDGGHGRGRGRGRGRGGDDVPMVGPSPSRIDDDNSGPGGDDGNSGPGGGGGGDDDSGSDDH